MNKKLCIMTHSLVSLEQSRLTANKIQTQTLQRGHGERHGVQVVCLLPSSPSAKQKPALYVTNKKKKIIFSFFRFLLPTTFEVFGQIDCDSKQFQAHKHHQRQSQEDAEINGEILENRHIQHNVDDQSSNHSRESHNHPRPGAAHRSLQLRALVSKEEDKKKDEN